jgi:hypothetical protein
MSRDLEERAMPVRRCQNSLQGRASLCLRLHVPEYLKQPSGSLIVCPGDAGTSLVVPGERLGSVSRMLAKRCTPGGTSKDMDGALTQLLPPG